MKRNLILTAAFMLATLLIATSITAFAQQIGSAPVNIVRIEKDPTNVVFRASHVDPARFQNATFVIPDTSNDQNAQLAILLTAMSLNKQLFLTFEVGSPNVIRSVRIDN